MEYLHGAMLVFSTVTTADWLIFSARSAPKSAMFGQGIWFAGWIFAAYLAGEFVF